MIRELAGKILKQLNYIKTKIQKDDINIDKKFIEKYLPVNPTIIDCGAHVGADSIELSTIPGSKVHAFEPVEHLYQKLILNTEKYTNIYCYKLALGNYNGKADFYVSSGDSDASSSLLPPKDHLKDHPTVYFSEVITVDCLTLDSWAQEQNITKVDMLWLDMQGFEQAMIETSETVLPTVSVIHTEVSMRETYEGVSSYKHYKRFLESKGFKVVKEAIPASFDMGNVLFVRQ